MAEKKKRRGRPGGRRIAVSKKSGKAEANASVVVNVGGGGRRRASAPSAPVAKPPPFIIQPSAGVSAADVRRIIGESVPKFFGEGSKSYYTDVTGSREQNIASTGQTSGSNVLPQMKSSAPDSTRRADGTPALGGMRNFGTQTSSAPGSGMRNFGTQTSTGFIRPTMTSQFVNINEPGSGVSRDQPLKAEPQARPKFGGFGDSYNREPYVYVMDSETGSFVPPQTRRADGMPPLGLTTSTRRADGTPALGVQPEPVVQRPEWLALPEYSNVSPVNRPEWLPSLPEIKYPITVPEEDFISYAPKLSEQERITNVEPIQEAESASMEQEAASVHKPKSKGGRPPNPEYVPLYAQITPDDIRRREAVDGNKTRDGRVQLERDLKTTYYKRYVGKPEYGDPENVRRFIEDRLLELERKKQSR